MNEHVKSPLKDILNEFFYTKGYAQRVEKEVEKEKVDEVKIESKSSNINNLIEDTSREM